MDISQLGKDRFLRKDPSQNDQTKGAAFAAANPVPKRGDDPRRKRGVPEGSAEDAGAPNIQTGTVIIACLIQTSALPYRVEMEGNDITFFDDTFEQNGEVIGDTSRLVFTHASAKEGRTVTQGFIFEKRASVYNTYDNVLSIYSLEPRAGAHNYLFVGRNAYLNDDQRHLASMHLAVNYDSSALPLPGNPPLNGVFQVEYAEDGVLAQRLFYAGRTESLFPGTGLPGYSSLIVGGDGGYVGLGYTSGALINVLLYMNSDSQVTLGAALVPDAASAYDIGSAALPIRALYADSVVGGISPGDGLVWLTGSGSPEGSVAAPVGSIYTNQAGGASTTLYVKTSGGSGNTGWTAK
jgi:hypothetical protein